MKITNATWEKRNFGMDAYEISIEKKDMRDYQEVLKKIDEQNFHNAYVVIKMPTGNLKLLHALEDKGYRFLETQLSMVNHFEPIESESNMLALDIKNECTVEIAPKKIEEWDKVINKITPGMFDTDRVSLDPALGNDMACKRYKNWCRDLFDNPTSEMCVQKIGSDIYGFSVSIKNEKTGVIDYVLGGMFEKYKDYLDNYDNEVNTQGLTCRFSFLIMSLSSIILGNIFLILKIKLEALSGFPSLSDDA